MHHGAGPFDEPARASGRLRRDLPERLRRDLREGRDRRPLRRERRADLPREHFRSRRRYFRLGGRLRRRLPGAKVLKTYLLSSLAGNKLERFSLEFFSSSFYDCEKGLVVMLYYW